MKTKERVILGIMISLFVSSAGMFYYHNFYTNIQANKSKVPVLVATKDIEKGLKLTKNNVKWVKMDKGNKNADYQITEQDLKTMVTSSKIYENEIINKKRLGKTNADEENSYSTYIINLNPDFSSEIKPGDLIRVYVQSVDKDGNIDNKLVFNSKEVLEVAEPEAKSNIKTLKIEATDKDAVSYYNAKQMGKIIALKYKDVLSKSDLEIPVIDLSKTINKEIPAAVGTEENK